MNKKRIAITLFMAFLSEIANKIVPLITLHLVAARLGATAFGVAQFSLWLIDWGVIFTMFGFMQVAPVMLRDATSAVSRSTVAGAVVVSRIMLAATAALALGFMVRDSSGYSQYKTAVYASSFILLSTALDSTWILLARQKMAVLSAASITAKLCSILAVAMLVKNPDDSVTFVVITNAVNAFISMASFLVAAKDIGFAKPSLRNSLHTLHIALPYAVAVTLIVILERFDLYLVERNLGLAATGVYAAASKLVTSLTPIIASVTSVFYSEMIAHNDIETIYRHLRASLFWVISIFAPIAVGIWMIDTEILRIVFGEEFTGGAHVLSILTFGAIAYAIILIFGFQLLALRKQWRPLVTGLFAGSIAGYLCALVFLVSHGSQGIAFAAVIGKWIAAVVIFFAAIRHWELPIKAIALEMARPLIPSIAMGLVIAPMAHWGLLPKNGLAVTTVSALVYCVLFSVANAKEAQLIWAKAIKKFKSHIN